VAPHIFNHTLKGGVLSASWASCHIPSKGAIGIHRIRGFVGPKICLNATRSFCIEDPAQGEEKINKFRADIYKLTAKDVLCNIHCYFQGIGK
jgi:hypothetical protein